MLRLYIPHMTTFDTLLELDADHHHYLSHVRRLKVGEPVRLFNEIRGEWEGVIASIKKNTSYVRLVTLVHPPTPMPPLHLLFSPLKHDALLFLVEKATELGVTHFHPVITAHTALHRVNVEKLTRNAREACQQCERIIPPVFSPLCSLGEKWTTWDPAIPVICLRERAAAPPLGPVLHTYSLGQPLGFFVGPEGGFSSAEHDDLKQRCLSATLGSRILRAETAALAALSAYQVILGEGAVSNK